MINAKTRINETKPYITTDSEKVSQAKASKRPAEGRIWSQSATVPLYCVAPPEGSG